jgi:leucyl-tRNA synthetase
MPQWEIFATWGFGASMAVVIFLAYQRLIKTTSERADTITKQNAEREERRHNEMIVLVRNNTEAMVTLKTAVTHMDEKLNDIKNYLKGQRG